MIGADLHGAAFTTSVLPLKLMVDAGWQCASNAGVGPCTLCLVGSLRERLRKGVLSMQLSLACPYCQQASICSTLGYACSSSIQHQAFLCVPLRFGIRVPTRTLTSNAATMKNMIDEMMATAAWRICGNARQAASTGHKNMSGTQPICEAWVRCRSPAASCCMHGKCSWQPCAA